MAREGGNGAHVPPRGVMTLNVQPAKAISYAEEPAPNPAERFRPTLRGH